MRYWKSTTFFSTISLNALHAQGIRESKKRKQEVDMKSQRPGLAWSPQNQ